MSDLNEDVLRVGDNGSFEELSRKPNPDNLVLQYVPGIDALLARAAQLKGAELSENQVARIRAGANVMAVPAEMAAALNEKRGYE